jgi:hypothetical protein
MTSIKLKVIPIMLVVLPMTAFAGIGERRWEFMPGEVDVKDFTHAHGEGVIYGCEKFSPNAVSFTLAYTNPDAVPTIKYGNGGSVTQNGQMFKIEGVGKLDVTYPIGGKYTITNITGKNVIGIDCSTGEVPLY